MISKLKQFLNTRFGFITLLVFCYWVKSIFVSYADLNLGLSDPYQHIIMWTNPIGFTLIIISIGLYLSRPLLSYITMIFLAGINAILLFANVIYYRQFSDFLTIKTIMSSAKVSKGLGMSTLALLKPSDVFIFLDLVIIIVLLSTKFIKIDTKSYGLVKPFAVTSIGVFALGLNMFLTETSRPRLLVNTFDRQYVVKFLGVNTFTAYDAIKTAQSNGVRKSANAEELNDVLQFTQGNYANPNPAYFGTMKGKNVIIIHLESFQQFLINMKVDGKEVMPFLNSLVKDKNTLSYSNFFHQVGLGRTSDAETMLETGTFGVSDGSVFTSLGSDNTFQAAPQILRSAQDYTSAVFHGNTGTFWNRNVVYKNFGYNYFFDASSFSDNKDDKIGYGLKDKLLFSESIKYLEQMQQPFYTKFITVTNHIPYPLDDANTTFKKPTTANQTVNDYFATAHYLDQALKEFFAYLKKSGLYDKSLIMLYGDHYGLSDSDNKDLAPLIGKDPATWTELDNLNMQRVPFILHAKGLSGGVKTEYAGEIDVLPTLMHLLGIDTKNYVQFGSDMLSSKHRQLVIFRNGNFTTPTYTVIGNKGSKGHVYDTKTAQELTAMSDDQMKEIDDLQAFVTKSLTFSDNVNNKNLLSYYTPKGFTPDDPTMYDYQNQYDQMVSRRKMLGSMSTSLYTTNKGSTVSMYKTDAPELVGNEDELTKLPESTEKSAK